MAEYETQHNMKSALPGPPFRWAAGRAALEPGSFGTSCGGGGYRCGAVPLELEMLFAGVRRRLELDGVGVHVRIGERLEGLAVRVVVLPPPCPGKKLQARLVAPAHGIPDPLPLVLSAEAPPGKVKTRAKRCTEKKVRKEAQDPSPFTMQKMTLPVRVVDD